MIRFSFWPLAHFAVHVPVLIVVMNLTPFEAIPGSQSAIVGGSLGGIVMFASRSHPHSPERSIFNTEVMMVIVPPLMMGVMLGVIFSRSLPQWCAL